MKTIQLSALLFLMPFILLAQYSIPTNNVEKYYFQMNGKVKFVELKDRMLTLEDMIKACDNTTNSFIYKKVDTGIYIGILNKFFKIDVDTIPNDVPRQNKYVSVFYEKEKTVVLFFNAIGGNKFVTDTIECNDLLVMNGSCYALLFDYEYTYLGSIRVGTKHWKLAPVITIAKKMKDDLYCYYKARHTLLMYNEDIAGCSIENIVRQTLLLVKEFKAYPAPAKWDGEYNLTYGVIGQWKNKFSNRVQKK